MSLAQYISGEKPHVTPKSPKRWRKQPPVVRHWDKQALPNSVKLPQVSSELPVRHGERLQWNTSSKRLHPLQMLHLLCGGPWKEPSLKSWAVQMLHNPVTTGKNVSEENANLILLLSVLWAWRKQPPPPSLIVCKMGRRKEVSVWSPTSDVHFGDGKG